MSGKKCSRFTFDESILRASEVARTRQSVVAACKQLRKQLLAIPSIVEQQLASVKASVEQWISETERDTQQPSSPVATFTDVSSWHAIAQKGQEMLRLLSKNTLLETDRCRSGISTIIEQCASNIESHGHLIETWLNSDAPSDFTKRIELVQELLVRDDLLNARQDSTVISKELAAAIATAQSKERQHVHNTLLSEVQQLKRDIKNCSFALLTTCAKTKEIFDTDLVECQRWIQDSSEWDSSTIPENESNQNLHLLAGKCREALKNGLKHLDDSRQQFHEQLGAIRSEFGSRLHELQEQWLSEEEGMEHWLKKEERETAKAIFAEWQLRIAENRFAGIEQFASVAEKNVNGLLDRLKTMKEGHQSRINVLKALRQVCANLGFGEVSPPRLLIEGDYTSRIAFVADTFNQGEITFYLALDRIEANACIGKSECHFEFGKVSEQLKKHFGIHTKFEMADAPTPRVIAKDEAEEPTGSGETASA